MSQRVPEWDVSDHHHNPELAGSLAQNLFSASKSKLWDHQQQQFCGRHELPEHVPDYNEVAELTWVNGHLALQGLVSKPPNRHHYRSSGLACYWADDNHDQASAAAARSAQNETEVDGTLDAIVLHEATRCDINGQADSVSNLPTLVDDMASWFQYPLNDFNQQDAAALPRKIIDEDIIMRGKCTDGTVRSISEAQQAATAHPANTESFDALAPCDIDTDQCNNSMVNRSTNPSGAKGSGTEVDDDGDEEREKVPTRDNKNGSMNFSHFSRPAVMMKANLHFLGAASGPTNIQRVRQHCDYVDEYLTDPHQPPHRQQDQGNVSASEANVPVSIVGSTNGLCTSGEISRSASLHIAKKASRSLPSQVISDDCITKALDRDRRRNCSISGSAATIAREMASETCDAQDFTFTSTSGCSPNNSTEKCRKETRWKRKSRAEEDWGCQSEVGLMSSAIYE